MINPEILREYDIRGIFQKSLTLEDVKKISYKLSTIIKKIMNIRLSLAMMVERLL